MKRINVASLILFILVLFLSSVTEAVRIRTRYYTTYYYRYYYYGYTTSTVSAGVIAGIVIGCLVGVAVLVGAIILCCVCCCGRGRGRPQGGQVIQTQSGTTVSTVASNVAYYPTAPGSVLHPPPVNHEYSAPPPSYNQVTSDHEGSVNLGFEDNKQTVYHPPS
ncbi:V-set and immunoglobulin domain-containing protein 10-like [Mizuhopecten yessoensis]|uniref:Cysteine and tyrosine-rich protein 1 n=1 Tax=Mizuhopecten yessoensis TaxID=6573 RepID=A0A210QWT4_MIZYE|nr:V-set and immunoglobulin domain-containing protein 10-like [Mizuhopecten yessoensis]OWF53207.1 hypothetical protein KP79_PYT11529 [Mizuhopecten yessoensis]